MSIKWKRGLLLGLVIYSYSLAIQNFWPDLNIYLDVLVAAILGGFTSVISDFIFEKKENTADKDNKT